MAVAYHVPIKVVDCSPSPRLGGPIRSSSFLVARTISTRPSWLKPWPDACRDAGQSCSPLRDGTFG